MMVQVQLTAVMSLALNGRESLSPEFELRRESISKKIESADHRVSENNIYCIRSRECV